MWRLILPLACAATPALATCPGPADLRAGVTLVQNAPYYLRSDVELRLSGFQELRVYGPVDGDKTVEIRSFDHALAPAVIQIGPREERFAYDVPVAALDRLDETGDARLTVTRQSGGETAEEALLFVFKGAGETEILGCSYDTWQVEEMRAGPDGAIATRRLTYAPMLGVVLAVDDGDAATSFAYSWIGTAADVAR